MKRPIVLWYAVGIRTILLKNYYHMHAIKLTFLYIILLYCCGCNQQQPTEISQPNILLLLTDDMGYGDVQHAGNPFVQTPNLDRLAKASTRFKYFYVSPVCAPTRASLLTGRYHQRAGVRSVTNGFETMDPEEVTLAEVLQDNGYRTAIFGKWHLGEYYPSLPNAQGFDEYLGFRTGHTADYFDAELERNGQMVRTQGYITDVLTKEALSFMIQREKEKPFFCYLAYNAPHTPLQIDSNWVQPYLERGLDERTARIYGMVENIDKNIGQLLDTLDGEQLLENTIVIFMSDNGPISGWRLPQEEMRYNAGLRDQKFTIYEGGIRTQCYWMWQGQWQEDLESEAIAAHIDVLPTLLDVLNIDVLENKALDGESLLPVLNGTGTLPTDRAFYQKYALATLRDPAPFPGGILRKGDWKMVNGTELYNLEQDPGELENLASQNPDLLLELRQSYEQWYADIVSERSLENVPITIGYEKENPVFVQPHHGIAEGNLKFTGQRGLLGERIGTHPSGVDGDWLANWKEPGDQITWKVEAVETGNYQVAIQTRDSTATEPVSLRLEVNEEVFDQTVALPRPAHEWQRQDLAELPLVRGPQTISLKLVGNLEESGFEVRALILERVEEDPGK